MTSTRPKHLKLPTVGSLALLAATLVLQAQGWQTIDDFQHTAGVSALGSDVGTDTSGSILFTAGGADTDASGQGRLAIVNVSLDQGATWTTLPSPAGPLWDWEHNRAFASAGDTLFAGSNGRNADWPAGLVTWFIRESIDGGLNWTCTDTLPGDPLSGCADIAISPSDDVYAAGSSATLGRIIRKYLCGCPRERDRLRRRPGRPWDRALHRAQTASTLTRR